MHWEKFWPVLVNDVIPPALLVMVAMLFWWIGNRIKALKGTVDAHKETISAMKISRDIAREDSQEALEHVARMKKLIEKHAEMEIGEYKSKAEEDKKRIEDLLIQLEKTRQGAREAWLHLVDLYEISQIHNIDVQEQLSLVLLDLQVKSISSRPEKSLMGLLELTAKTVKQVREMQDGWMSTLDDT